MFKRLAGARWDTRVAILLWVVTVLVCGTSIAVARLTYADMAANSASDDAIRNQLLIEALDYVGTCDPESTAAVWAEGLRLRSAALQFAVMNSNLREIYAAQLETTFPNWVTGVSSPWVDSYEILSVTPLDDTHAEIALKFTTATSTGIADTYYATLMLEKDGAFWRIADIDADEELSVYTGFTSP